MINCLLGIAFWGGIVGGREDCCYSLGGFGLDWHLRDVFIIVLKKKGLDFCEK